MSSDEYVYVIYIATDAQTLWRALLEPEPGVEEHDDARRRHQIRQDRIVYARSAFDGRPFAAMSTGK